MKEELEKIASLKKESLDLGESWYDRLTETVSLANKALSESPPTNEAELFVWTDELVKNYAEQYRFSSSRISIEQFKKTGGYNQKVVNSNYENAIEESKASSESEGYWKQRCEAAEKVIESGESDDSIYKYDGLYETWQQLKSKAPGNDGEQD